MIPDLDPSEYRKRNERLKSANYGVLGEGKCVTVYPLGALNFGERPVVRVCGINNIEIMKEDFIPGFNDHARTHHARLREVLGLVDSPAIEREMVTYSKTVSARTDYRRERSKNSSRRKSDDSPMT
jgi:hypothetical protein